MPVIPTTGGFEGSVEINGEQANIDPNKAIDWHCMVHQEYADTWFYSYRKY